MRTFHALLVLRPLLMTPTFETHQAAPVEPHPLHLSHANMVLEGNHAIINVRLFQDDLELALGLFHNIEALRVRPDPIVDSLFADYFNSRFTMSIADSIHEGSILASGKSEDMWWYAVTFASTDTITAVAFRNDLLFDIFNDQRNITRVLHTSTDKQRTFYSVATDPETHNFSAN